MSEDTSLTVSSHSTTDDMQARHKALVEALQGESPMTWDDWASPIYDSQYLTSSGQRVAFWAVGVLKRTLGSDFLERAIAKPPPRPIFCPTLWPGANNVPWVYANLFQLAAQIELHVQAHSKHCGKVQRVMRDNLDAPSWVHSLLQLEVASLGLKAGWKIRFEMKLSNDKPADVCLTKESSQLLVETVAIGDSVLEQESSSFFHEMLEYVYSLKNQYSVYISGILGEPLEREAKVQWFQKLEEAAQSVARIGIIRLVSNQAGGRLEISREKPTSEEGKLEGAPVIENVWSRLVARLKDKNSQYTGVGPVWVRLEEGAGLWHFTKLHGMMLHQKLDALIPALQAELTSFPDLAGVILSPAVLWASDAPPAALNVRIERSGGIAVRSPIPGGRFRETIIVAQAGQSDEEIKIFADWYEQEEKWLCWALEQLGHPPFNVLVSA